MLSILRNVDTINSVRNCSRLNVFIAYVGTAPQPASSSTLGASFGVAPASPRRRAPPPPSYHLLGLHPGCRRGVPGRNGGAGALRLRPAVGPDYPRRGAAPAGGGWGKDGEMDVEMAVERDGNRRIGASHTITIITSNNNNNNFNSNDNNNNDSSNNDNNNNYKNNNGNDMPAAGAELPVSEPPARRPRRRRRQWRRFFVSSPGPAAMEAAQEMAMAA